MTSSGRNFALIMWRFPNLFCLAKPAPVKKEKINKSFLVIVLCQAIRLMHPMAPFITEELFHRLKDRLNDLKLPSNCDPYTAEAIAALQCPACIVSPYPQVIRESDINPVIEHTFNLVDRVIYTLRNIRGEMKLPPSTETTIQIIGSEDDPNFKLVRENKGIISALVRTSSIAYLQEEPTSGFACTGIVDSLKIRIPLPENLVQQEKSRLIKERERLLSSHERLQTQLGNTEFTSNAPAQLIEKQKQLLQQTETALKETDDKLQLLGVNF